LGASQRLAARLVAMNSRSAGTMYSHLCIRSRPACSVLEVPAHLGLVRGIVDGTEGSPVQSKFLVSVGELARCSHRARAPLLQQLRAHASLIVGWHQGGNVTSILYSLLFFHLLFFRA
ncbi:hypothetical protein PFISCL1PPCAC_9750, partial [Pristionchus fissidentatus]